ncbi:MAG: ECF transporter S component [Lachnospirales bacterium]
MEKSYDVKYLATCGVATAIVCLVTMFLQVPSGVGGYVNLGDGVIYIFAAVLGNPIGFVCAGLGSALADLLLGYAVYAPFTLIIKGIMGFVVAFGCKNVTKYSARSCISIFLATIIMLIGYAITAYIMQGTMAAALASISSNFVQAIGGVVVYAVFVMPLTLAHRAVAKVE